MEGPLAGLAQRIGDTPHGVPGLLASNKTLLVIKGDDQLYFRGGAVLEELGYCRSGGAQALRELVPDYCKHKLSALLSPAELQEADSSQEESDAPWLSELGLYELSMNSQWGGATTFSHVAHFVIQELVPGIRRQLSQVQVRQASQQILQIQEQAARIEQLNKEIESCRLLAQVQPRNTP